MRHVKQLIYGIFYLALWSGLIAGIYAWKKPLPSCFDGRQDQQEEGIDCGGPCSRVCIPAEIAPIEEVGTPKLILLSAPSSTPRVSLIAEVRNRNDAFGASGFGYEFQVYDQGGTLVASVPDSSFIYPGEIKYLVKPNVPLPEGSAPAYVKLVLQEPQWTSTAHFPRPQLTIQSAVTAAGNNDNLVTDGTVTNQDSLDFPTVSFVALYYDPAGNIVGTSVTEIENVAPATSREFHLFHPLIPAAVPERTQVFATAFNPR